MVARGYSNQYLVADALGTHDGVVPVLMLNVLLEAAENWIDIRTGRSWLEGTVTDEPHTLSGDFALVWLRRSPVTAITQVTGRTLWVGSTVTTLPSTGYELIDPLRGKVLISSGFYNSQLAISYTTNVPLPADIQLAATLLVASWARPMISTNGMPSTMGTNIQSYTIGQDLAVTFKDSDKQIALQAPVEVLRIVDQYGGATFA
jgi:hypothetical protein